MLRHSFRSCFHFTHISTRWVHCRAVHRFRTRRIFIFVLVEPLKRHNTLNHSVESRYLKLDLYCFITFFIFTAFATYGTAIKISRFRHHRKIITLGSNRFVLPYDTAVSAFHFLLFVLARVEQVTNLGSVGKTRGWV